MTPCISCGGYLYALPIDAQCSVKRHLQYCCYGCMTEWEGYLDLREAFDQNVKDFREWEDAMYAASWDGKS